MPSQWDQDLSPESKRKHREWVQRMAARRRGTRAYSILRQRGLGHEEALEELARDQAVRDAGGARKGEEYPAYEDGALDYEDGALKARDAEREEAAGLQVVSLEGDVLGEPPDEDGRAYVLAGYDPIQDAQEEDGEPRGLAGHALSQEEAGRVVAELWVDLAWRRGVKLTDAEIRVLGAMLLGDTQAQAAREFGVSKVQVSKHLSSLIRKLRRAYRTSRGFIRLGSGRTYQVGDAGDAPRRVGRPSKPRSPLRRKEMREWVRRHPAFTFRAHWRRYGGPGDPPGGPMKLDGDDVAGVIDRIGRLHHAEALHVPARNARELAERRGTDKGWVYRPRGWMGADEIACALWGPDFLALRLRRPGG